jgi:shikimate dehydrogenase
LTIANRTVERAERLAADLVKAGVGCAVRAIPLEEEPISKALANASVVINCTSVGLLAPDESPLPGAAHLRAGQTVLDMVYRPLKTSLLKRAAAEGAKPVDGLWMLIFQALEQLRLWTERQCSTEVAQKAHRYLARQIA